MTYREDNELDIDCVEIRPFDEDRLSSLNDGDDLYQLDFSAPKKVDLPKQAHLSLDDNLLKPAQTTNQQKQVKLRPAPQLDISSDGSDEGKGSFLGSNMTKISGFDMQSATMVNFGNGFGGAQS